MCPNLLALELTNDYLRMSIFLPGSHFEWTWIGWTVIWLPASLKARFWRSLKERGSWISSTSISSKSSKSSEFYCHWFLNWKQPRCIQLNDTDRLICNMIFSGQVMTLTWGQPFKMTFKCQIIVHSTRLHERNTMLAKVMSWLSWVKSYYWKTFFVKTAIFRLIFSPWGLPLTWDEIWGHNPERVSKGLSNAPSRGAVAVLVRELCDGVSKIVEIGKIWPLMTSGDLTFDLTKKWPRYFLHYFFTFFRMPLTACHYVAHEPS